MAITKSTNEYWANGRTMIIDTHCHFDMMPYPDKYIQEQERLGNIVIGMTNLPSHFEMGFPHVKKLKHIRLSLGMHPQLAEHTHELVKFREYLDYTSYIGEIGLDFSTQYISTKAAQINNLEYVLDLIKGKKKIVSVHSRNAEREVLYLLKKYEINNVIFHWFSGSVDIIPEIVAMGYYFSVNESMIHTKKGMGIIQRIPRDRILSETDAPYNKKHSINNLLKTLGMSEQEMYHNFRRILSGIM